MTVREILERALNRAEAADDDPQEVAVLRDGIAQALDAEGVGLPWVSVETELPSEAEAYKRSGSGYVLVSDGKTAQEMLAMHDPRTYGWSHWCYLSAIPLPGQSPDLPATDALYGFAAWLTCREEPVTLGANHDAAPAAELVARFRESQVLPELSDAYPGNLKPYPLSGQSGAKPDECSLCSGRGAVNSCDEAGVTSVCPRCDQTGEEPAPSAGLREAALSMRACADGEDALAAQLTERARIMRRAADEVDAALRAADEPAPSAGLREALEWYAEQTRDCRKMGRDGDRARQALDADGGARALAALRADEEGGHG